MRQKGYVPIIILLVVFVLGVVGYFGYTKGYLNKLIGKNVTQTYITPEPYPLNTKPTSSPFSVEDWKMYKNDRFQFSFKYPPKFVLDKRYEDTYLDQGGVSLYSQADYEVLTSGEGRSGPPYIEIWVFPNLKKLSALDWMKTETSYSNFTNQKYSIINVDGEEGLIYRWEGMGTGLQAVVSKNEMIYVFSDFEYDIELPNIISTFKFTQ